MTAEFFKLLLLSIVCGAISMTISKSKAFAPLRRAVSRSRSKLGTFLGEGLECPYCTSHWVAFILTFVYFPRPLNSGFMVVDFFVSVMMLVALASATTRMIFSAYSGMD
jgi:hypothetical protein